MTVTHVLTSVFRHKFSPYPDNNDPIYLIFICERLLNLKECAESQNVSKGPMLASWPTTCRMKYVS